MSRLNVRGRRAVSCAVVFAGIPAMASMPQYRVVDLSLYPSTPGATGVRALSVSQNGQYITGTANIPGGQLPFLQGPVGSSVLYTSIPGAPNGGTYMQGQAVNDNGVMALTSGNSGVLPSGGVPFIYNSVTGTVTSLPLPPENSVPGSFGYGGRATTINNSLDVGGYIGAGTTKAVVWHMGGGTPYMETLGALDDGGQMTTVNGMSNSGWIVGEAVDPNNAARTRSYARDADGNYIQNIPAAGTTLVSGVETPNNAVIARDVNDTGMVVGTTMLNSGTGQAFYWTQAGGSVLIPTVVPGSSGTAWGVSNDGWVAGQMNSTGFVFNGSQTFYLNDLIGVGGSSFNASSAFSMSDNHVITGQTQDAKAYALVPISGTTTTAWKIGTGSWDTAGNWNDGVPDGDNVTAVLGQNGNTSAAVVTLDATRTVQGLTFNSSVGYTLAAGSGASLRMKSFSTDPAQIAANLGRHTITAPVILDSNTLVSGPSGGTLTFSGVISGTGSPIITGAATSVVELTGANTYTTPTIVAGGVLKGVSGVGLPSGSALYLTGGVYATSGTFTRSVALSGTDAVAFPAGSVGGFTATAALNVNIGGSGATLEWGTPAFSPTALTLNGSTASGAVTLVNPINLNGTSLGFRVLGNTATYSGVLADGTATSGIEVANSTLLILTGVNTYTGPTKLTSGTLRATVGTHIPTASNINLAGGILDTAGTVTRDVGTGSGQLQVTGGTTGFTSSSSALAISLGSSPIAWGSATFNPTTFVLNTIAATGALTFTTPLDLNGATRQIAVFAGTSTLTGALTGAAGSGLNKYGAGNLILSNANNNFTGNLQILAGTVTLAAGSALGADIDVVVTNGATFNVTAAATGSPQVWSLVAGQSLTMFQSSTVVGNLGGSGDVILRGTGVTVPNNLTGALSLTVQNNTATQAATLTGTNSYSGPTTVNNGILRVVTANVTGLSANTNVNLVNGVLETRDTFSRALGAVGGQVQVTGGTSGFSANTAPLLVSLGGTATPTALTWGSQYFNPAAFVLNATTANQVLTFANSMDLNGGSRTLNVNANTVTFTGNITGGGGSALTKGGNGVLVLTGTNTYSGPTTAMGGVIRFAVDGVNIPADSAISLTSTIIETSGTFSHSGGVSLEAFGTSGFGAFGGPLTVALGGTSSPLSLVWGNSPFSPVTFALNSVGATAGVTFLNPVDMNAGNRTITVGGDTATMTGSITDGSGSTTTNLTKSGSGTLVLTNDATFGNPQGLTYFVNVVGNVIPQLNGAMQVNGGTLQIGNGGTTGSLTAATYLNASAAKLVFNRSDSYTYSGNITSQSGNGIIELAGVGSTVTLSGNLVATSLAFTGSTVVSGANSRLIVQSPLRPVTRTLVVTGPGANATLQGSGVTGEFSAISVVATGSVTVDVSNRPTSQKVLITSGLDLTKSGNSYLGTLDLTNNDMVVRDGSEATLRGMVASWWNGGARNGTGLKSSLAAFGADPLTTLAVVPNALSVGTRFTNFNGASVGSTDILVKYTYLGDTNLDGKLTADDMNALIAGLRGGLTGWTNGDTNYDGVVNGDDFTNLLTAMRFQGIQYSNTLGETGAPGNGGAVPEPTALGLVLAAVPLMSRRRRA